MTKDEAISEVDQCFGSLPRPDIFIRGTCKCSECLEHEQTMQSLTPDELALDKLDNPGWDPMCFASDDAFAYFIPGLVRLTLDHADDYVDQFLFHIDNSDRVSSLSSGQATALIHVLDYLVMKAPECVDDGAWQTDVLFRARKKLEQRAERAN